MYVDGAEIPFGGGPNTWGYDKDELFVSLPTGEEPGDRITFVYPQATVRERRLHQAFSDVSGTSFTDYQAQDGWVSRSGILLNAPGRIAWAIAVPAAGEFHFVPTLVEPEILDEAPSDGAEIVVTVEVDGARHEVHREAVALHAAPYRRVDLSRWEGRDVLLEVASVPGASPRGDHVLLAEPVVASRKNNPRTVLMVFIDTLRPDHMSLYGYQRDTTAAIDHLATTGAVFTEARSIAPWTLPSARTIVTGMQPESYETSMSLQETLRDQGWATAFIAGNVYLSANFDMHRGWDYHTVGMWPLAEVATDDALAWLDDRAGRDVLLQVHYMGVHLPYKEPQAYRHMYAGSGPDGLPDEFHLSTLRSAKLRKEEDRQYIRDRYDNNIRYVTDQVQRLVSRLDDNDVLVLYADHGEEFWDHGGLEHGHTVYDELLRVPLVIRAPGVAPGRIDAPVSLLDITPTILDLVGVAPAQALDGASLVPLTQGDPAAEQRFRARHHAFGRPLYGHERWGVIAGDKKWSTHEGDEALYDLSADPGEAKDLLKRKGITDRGAPFRAAMAEAIRFPVDISYRFQPTQNRGGAAPPEGLELVCAVPGGVRDLWSGDDPLENADVVFERLSAAEAWDRMAALGASPEVVRPSPLDPSDGGFRATWLGPGPQELYVTPNLPVSDLAGRTTCAANWCPGGACVAQSLLHPAERTWPDPSREPLTKASWGTRRSLLWSWGIAPADPRMISARDEESNDLLEALGYKEHDP